MSGAYDRYIKKHENDSKQEKTQQKTQQKAQNKSNENLSTYERFQKSNPDYDYDTGIAYYNSESFQRKQKKQQEQTTQPDSVHIEKQTTNNNKTVTPTVRSSSNKLLQDIKAANGNTTKVQKGSNIERKSAGPSVRSATDKLLNDIVTARNERNNAIKEEYESIPERNIFERLPNWLKREYSTFYGMFPQTLPEDYPNYREDYNRKQELAAEYEKIRNEEAIQSLRDMGMTEAELRALGQDVMRQSDIDAMVAAGFSDEDIRKHADYLYKRGERAKAKLYDLTAGKGKVGPNDLSFDDYMQILSNYQMPEVSKDAKERPVSNSLYTLVTNPFESVANTLGNAYNYLAGKPIRHNDSVTETIRDTVNESIGNPLGRIAYSGALSIGDMAVAQGIDFALGGGGAISAGIQAVEKASEVSNDAVDRGLTPNRIFASTIASAVTTFVTEKISMGKLSKIAEKGLTDYSAKEIAKTLGASFVTEGAQEGMEDVADWITGSLISWDKNEFNTAYKNYLESGESKEEAVKHVISDKLVELISDVVMGGIGGGVMGGVNTGFAYATGRIQPSPHVNTENVLQSDTALNQLVEAVQTIDTTNLSEEFAQRVEHAQEVAQKPSEELTVEDVVDMANAVNEQAGPDNNLAQTIQEINYQANYERNINEYIETGKIEEKENELPIEKAAREQAQLAVKDYEQTEIQQKRAAERQLNQELKNFNRNIQTDNQSENKINKQTRQSLEKAATYFENDTAAQNYINNYKGQNLSLYTEASYLAYSAGESGQSFDTFRENSSIVDYMIRNGGIDESYLKTLYYNGLNSRNKEPENVVLQKNENRGFATNLSPEDKLAVVKKAIAKKFNIEVETNFEDADTRGSFVAELAKLVTNSTSDNEYATIIHEMFEFARSYNAKGMELVDNTLVNMIVSKSDESKFIDAVNKYKEAYRKAGKEAPEGSSLKAEENKTLAEAQDEFINDAISYIFSTDEGMKNFVDYLFNDNQTTQQEKVSVIQSIKDWIDHLITTIKNFLSGNKTNQLGYKYAERLGFTSDELEGISRMLVGVLEDARANLAAMTEQGEANNKQEGEDKKAHSISVTSEQKEELRRFADEAYTGKGQTSYKRNQINIVNINSRYSNLVNKATDGRIDLTNKRFAFEASKLYHLIESHSNPKIEAERGQIAYTVKDIDNILEAMINPDIIEDVSGKSRFEERDTFAVAKNINGEYIIVLAVGGKTNPNVVPTEILIFSENKWNNMQQQGKTIKEVVYENTPDVVITQEDINKIKKNRVIAVPYESNDSLAQTSETLPHSPLFDLNISKSEEKSNTESGKTRNSIAVTEDSTGKELTKGQQEFFKDSKIRDKEGRLLRLYHGSMANFTVFDIGEARDSEDIEAFFFSPNAEEAEGYGNTREFYLNITNPADFDTAYDIFFKHRKENPAGAGARAREELISLGYDGVAAIDQSDPEYPEYLAFYPEQIKLVSNTKPTKSEDIRYSLKVTDTEGRELTKGQQSYFKKSVIRDKNGRLKVMYHGTPGAGFTIFENSDDGISYFFTDKKSVAASYSGVDYVQNPDTPMSLDAINEEMWNICGTSDEDHFFKAVNGKVEYWDRNTGELAKEKTFDTLRDAQNYFVDEYIFPMVYQGMGSPSNYEVYLNAENPFVYDAKGKEWNDLEPEEYKRHFSDLEIVPVGDKFEIDYQENGAYFHKIYTEEELDNIFGDGTGTMARLRYDADGQYYEANVYLDKNNKRIFSNTRELARYAKENGYDSLIINDVVDSGGYNLSSTESSQVVVVFNSNQIKSVYNENPTKNEDIRHSIDVPFIDSFLEIDEEVKKTESALKEMIDKKMDLDSDISKKMISDVASYIRNKYNSTYKKEWLESSITAIFKFLQNNNVRMEDIMYIMSDIAKPILENVKNAEPEQEKLYKDIVNTVKSYKIKLDAGQKQEVINAYGSYKNFVNSMRGKITLSNDGIALDNIWTELVDKTGGSLSYGTVPNDQPIELANLINSLNPTYASLEGQALEDAAMDVSLDIISQFYIHNSMTEAAKAVKGELTKRANKFKEDYKKRYNEALKQVEAEKAMNIKRLAEEIDSLTAEQQEAIRTGDSVNQAMIENIRNDYKRRLDRLRAESNEKIARAKAQYQNSWINKNLRRERSTLKNRVLREVKALQNMIAHPAEGASKHVPINLIKPTIEMLEAINLDNGGRNKAIADRLKKMSEVYESFKNDDTYSFDYDERIASDIKELQEMFTKRSYADLSITELQRVIEIVTALKTQIKNANNLILQDKLKDAKIAAEGAINDVKGSRRHDNAAMNALNRYGNLHLNAYREFRKLSGYKDGALMDIYNDLDEGSKREMQIQKDLGAIFQDVLEGQKNQKEVKKFISTKENDLVDIGITDKNGKPIKITRAMRMSLIMHSMNASNMRHVLGSGITVPNMYYFEKGKMEEAYAKGTNYRFVDYTEFLNAIQQNNQAKIEELTKQAQQRIEDMKKDLSEWEKDFLKDAEKMFHEETGKLINETSMKLKGYALARVKNYFPIATDRHFTNQEWAGLVQNGSLEGSGFLKERVISTKPILLEDITNVIQRQIKSVSKYAGLAVPVRNFETIMKQTSRDQSDGQLHNLYETIDKTWGSSDTNWLKNLMQDIQGGRSEKGNFLMNLRGQFAGATLTLNPSVAIKQAASYPTAAAVVGYKALGKAVSQMGKGFITQNGIKELEDINPLLWYRNQGNATQELADAKAVGFGKKLPLWAQKAVNWTQWFDTGTVRTLEYAAKYYVDDNFKNLKQGSEEYWQKVSEVFTNVVEQTQPNYSTLHKADIIRNPNSFVKMLVMFKTQPMQNFGIIYDAMGELNAAKVSGDKQWVKEASSKAALAVSSQAVSATVFSAMTILAQLLLHRWWKYRDDDGKWDWGKFLVALGEGALSCLTGAFIGGSELYEALKHIFTGSSYYGIEVSVAEMVNDFVENTGNLVKNGKALWDANTTEDKEKAMQKLLKSSINLGSTVGEFGGTPVNNIKNMLTSMYFYATDIIRSIDEGELSFSDDSNIATWDIKTQYERLYEAMQNGDTEKYEKLVHELIEDYTEDKAEEIKKGELTEEDIAENVEDEVVAGILKLMKADYLEEKISKEEVADYLINKKGKTEEEAFFQMREWETGLSKFEALKNNISAAIENPTDENWQAVEDEADFLMEHGVEKGDITGKYTEILKEKYLNNTLSYDDTIKYLMEKNGKNEEEAFFAVREWETGLSKYEALKNGIKEAATNPSSENWNAVDEQINFLMEHGADKGDITSQYTSVFKEMYLNEEIDYNSVIKLLMEKTKKDEEEAYFTVREWETGLSKNEALKNGIVEAVKNPTSENWKVVDDEIKHLMEHGSDESDIKSQYTSVFKELYTDGELTYDQTTKLLMDKTGKDKNEAYFTIREWETGFSDYGVLKDSIKNSDRKAMLAEIDNLLAHGKKKDGISSTITREYKEEYIKLYNQGKAADLNSLLRAALTEAGYTDDQAKKKLEGWLK